MSEQHAPSDDQVRGRYCDGTYLQTGRTIEGDDFDAWLARVRRDAARRALNGLAMKFERMGDYADLADQPGRPFWEAQDETEEYRDEFYPETEDQP